MVGKTYPCISDVSQYYINHKKYSHFIVQIITIVFLFFSINSHVICAYRGELYLNFN